MEKFFFITAMLLNAETLELEPKYNQQIFFYNRINCEAYVQANWSILHDGLQLFLDQKGDTRKIQSIGCIGITEDELKDLIKEQETTISA
tara:strand:+ start:1226 stop:1495 length:270 start_codon:yes stop_codon:yes gene_type:complete